MKPNKITLTQTHDFDIATIDEMVGCGDNCTIVSFNNGWDDIFVDELIGDLKKVLDASDYVVSYAIEQELEDGEEMDLENNAYRITNIFTKKHQSITVEGRVLPTYRFN